jgi:type II secretory pathway pseudopilin PulG
MRAGGSELKAARIAGTGGFTIIEVAVAIMVFTFLMLIFASAMPMAKKAVEMNGQYAQANSLCQHKIDQLRAVGFGRLTYDELSDAGIIDTSPASLPYHFDGVDEVSDYLNQATSTINITQPDATEPDILKVTITITWKTTNYETKPSSLTLSALISNAE